jgi:hypothetical protein
MEFKRVMCIKNGVPDSMSLDYIIFMIICENKFKACSLIKIL